jgi:hypothetical protein
MKPILALIHRQHRRIVVYFSDIPLVGYSAAKTCSVSQTKMVLENLAMGLVSQLNMVPHGLPKAARLFFPFAGGGGLDS